MVEDENNFDAVHDAFESGLGEGLEKLHGKTLRQLVTNMRNGQDALGNPWRPLSAKTVLKKGSATPLIDEGRLLTDINNASSVDRAEGEAIIGTNLDYAIYHELGAPEAGIPRRPIFAPAGKYAERHAADVIGKEIDARLEGAEI